jgi:hypothetical protein
MPVSSVSGAISTSVYFTSLFLLLGFTLVPVRAACQEADLSAARNLAAGLAGQIDDLSPGMTTVLRFASLPGVPASVALSGASIVVSVGGESVRESVVWPMPDLNLSSDRAYVVSLDGGAIDVA